MTILQALENALETLAQEGYMSGDVHDDLALVISKMRGKYRAIGQEEL